MKIKLYLQDAYKELVEKVTWPAWNELQSSAIVVMVASMIIAIIIYFMDSFFRFLMMTIYNLFGY